MTFTHSFKGSVQDASSKPAPSTPQLRWQPRDGAGPPSMPGVAPELPARALPANPAASPAARAGTGSPRSAAAAPAASADPNRVSQRFLQDATALACAGAPDSTLDRPLEGRSSGQGSGTCGGTKGGTLDSNWEGGGAQEGTACRGPDCGTVVPQWAAELRQDMRRLELELTRRLHCHERDMLEARTIACFLAVNSRQLGSIRAFSNHVCAPEWASLA